MERLHREIVAFASAFIEKLAAEVLAAKVTFNEELAVHALELAVHFDRKLVVELAAANIFATEQQSVELEVLNYEHELELRAERDKYHKKITMQMNESNNLRDAISVAEHATELET